MLRGGKMLILSIKLVKLSCFSVEYLSDLYTREILREEGVDIRRRILYLAVSSARELSEYHSEEHYKGNEAKHHQRELIIKTKHRCKYAYDDKAILHEVNEKVGEHHRNRVGIVRYSRNQLTYRDLMKLRMRKALDMSECILTYLGKYLLSYTLKKQGLAVRGYQRDNEDARVNNN